MRHRCSAKWKSWHYHGLTLGAHRACTTISSGCPQTATQRADCHLLLRRRKPVTRNENEKPLLPINYLLELFYRRRIFSNKIKQNYYIISICLDYTMSKLFQLERRIKGGCQTYVKDFIFIMGDIYLDRYREGLLSRKPCERGNRDSIQGIMNK